MNRSRPTDSIAVLVTGLAGGSVGMQILKALRLSDLPLKIFGADLHKEVFGSSLVEEMIILPTASDESYLETLLEVIKQYRLGAVFPGSEPELLTLSHGSKQIKDLSVMLPVQPPELLTSCLDKLATMSLLRRHGFSVPDTTLVASAADLHLVTSFPVVCKPIRGGGSGNVFLAQSSDELRNIGSYLLGLAGKFVAQEYIGRVDSEYTVGVLTDLDGHLIDSIAVHRQILSALSNRIKVHNLTGRKELGDILAVSNGISQGTVGRFAAVTSYCTEAALAINARGPINFQCRVADGKVYIFEINPRFSGTTSIRALAGFNEPELLIRRHLLGEKVGPVAYRETPVRRGLQEALREDQK